MPLDRPITAPHVFLERQFLPKGRGKSPKQLARVVKSVGATGVPSVGGMDQNCWPVERWSGGLLLLVTGLRSPSSQVVMMQGAFMRASSLLPGEGLHCLCRPCPASRGSRHPSDNQILYDPWQGGGGAI